MPASERAASRHHEYVLFSNKPPVSRYVRRNHGSLYLDHAIDPYYVSKLESIRNEKCIFKLEGFHKFQSGVNTKEITEVSRSVRQHCQTRSISLRKFLAEFREYAAKCGVKESVRNVADYIKRKSVEAELEIVLNYPKTFDFLNEPDSACEEICSPHETDKYESDFLKVILGIDKTEIGPKVKRNLNNSVDKNSCAEFFQLFNNNKLESKCHSYTHLSISFEEFARSLQLSRGKASSVENMANKGR
jgi:hypothetical protein